MQKEFVLGFTLLLLLTTSAFASQNPGNGEKAKENHGSVISQENKEKHNKIEEEITTTETSIPPTASEAVSEPPQLTESSTQTTHVTDSEEEMGESKNDEGVSALETACDPNAEWKNHGQYVSCVAKTHPGGNVVSEAARSAVGKKNEPTAVPSASPTETPTGTPPITSAETEVTIAFSPWETLKKAIARFLQGLPFLR